jgi:uncharacterized protein YggE
MKPLTRFFALFAISSFYLCAQDLTKVHFVRASGEASVSAKPDRAQINIGVITRAATAQAASAENASQSTQVIESIKRIIGSKGDAKTSGYSINPQYEYTNGKPPKLTGYETSNTVEVTVDDLLLLGKVIDQATSKGANQINGISFSLRNDGEVRSRALAEAARKARSNAEGLAKSLDVHVVGLLEAEPTEIPVARPVMMRAVAVEGMAAKMPTPIEAGNLDIHASVTVTMQVQ